MKLIAAPMNKLAKVSDISTSNELIEMSVTYEFCYRFEPTLMQWNTEIWNYIILNKLLLCEFYVWDGFI